MFGFIFPIATSILAGLLMAIALGAGGFGIANEKRWGYAVAVAGAVLQVVMLLAVFGSSVLTSTVIINFIFDGALVCPAPAPHEPRVPAHLVQVAAPRGRCLLSRP